MSRPLGSKNKAKQPPETTMSEIERMEYVARLLLEIAEEELNGNKAKNAAT